MEGIRFLRREEVEVLHEKLVSLFGGSYGVRDENLLESALNQPQTGFGDEYFHSFPFEMAAAYLFHSAKNHPFVDGNKRTAFACAETFLRLHGYFTKMNQNESYNLVIQVASESLDKKSIAQALESAC